MLPGEAVRGGDGERPRVVRERGARGEIRLVDGQPVAQHVDVAPAQRPVGVEGLDLLEPDLAGGIAGLERRDKPAERWALGGEDEADAQQPADGAGELAGLGQRLVQAASAGARLRLSSSPAGVRRTRRLVRSKTLTPSRDSRTRTASLTPGWEMPRRSAVRPKCSSSASTRKIRSSRSSTSCHINQRS